jgi:mRNA-degrading endonuclease YafQ of YafQ-DinJ toxin-antitoxin module
MKVVYSENFKKNVEKLPIEIKRQLKKKLEIMLENPRHPSLRVKKLKGRKDGVFEASINMDIRMTWEYVDGGILLRNIGEHEETLKNP